MSFDVVNITEEEQKSYYKFADAGGPDMFNFGNTFITPPARARRALEVLMTSSVGREAAAALNAAAHANAPRLFLSADYSR